MQLDILSSNSWCKDPLYILHQIQFYNVSWKVKWQDFFFAIESLKGS